VRIFSPYTTSKNLLWLECVNTRRFLPLF